MPPAPTRDDTIAKLRDVWTSITGLVTTLDAADWDLPTDCPGWTVRDQLAHLLAFEQVLAGHPSPADDLAAVPEWVHNDIGKANERAVHYWRSRPVTEMLDTWTRTVDERLAQLSAASDADLAADTWTPLGPGTVLDLMQVRILDHWIHEQDIRRATTRPGHESGPAAEHTIDRLLAGIPMIVAKRAAAPEGASVVLELTGPVTREHAVTIDSGRAHPTPRPPDPTVTLRMTSTKYAELSAGRTPPEPAITNAQVTWTGNTPLAQKITTNLTIIP